MVASVTFQPYAQSVGNAGLFNATSTGLRQGTAFADPATRFRLRGGILAQSETVPMWGGVGVYANVPGLAGQPSYSFGPVVGRAVSLNDSVKPLAGFSVFDEAYAMITSPQSPVPLIGSGGSVNWYPLKSLARIVVEADPSLVSLRGGPINPQVSWDYTNQMLIPFSASQTITSGTYNSASGLVTLTMSTSQSFSAGDSILISGLTGTGAFASLNGTYTALSVSGTTVTYTAATGLGAATITGGVLAIGGQVSAALPVTVLDVQAVNCEVVSYAAATGFATWVYTGAAAVIQI